MSAGMTRITLLLFVALLLASCAHEDLRPPCKHPSLLDRGDCGPLHPVN